VLAQLRLIEPKTDGERVAVESLRSRTALIIKMITRLYEHPPPNR